MHLGRGGTRCRDGSQSQSQSFGSGLVVLAEGSEPVKFRYTGGKEGGGGAWVRGQKAFPPPPPPTSCSWVASRHRHLQAPQLGASPNDQPRQQRARGGGGRLCRRREAKETSAPSPVPPPPLCSHLVVHVFWCL